MRRLFGYLLVIGLPVLPDPLLPVITVDEASTGPADDRHLQFLHGLDDIKAKALLIGQW